MSKKFMGLVARVPLDSLRWPSQDYESVNVNKVYVQTHSHVITKSSLDMENYHVVGIITVVIALAATVLAIVSLALTETQHNGAVHVSAVVHSKGTPNLYHGMIVDGKVLQKGDIILSQNAKNHVALMDIQGANQPPTQSAMHEDFSKIKSVHCNGSAIATRNTTPVAHRTVGKVAAGSSYTSRMPEYEARFGGWGSTTMFPYSTLEHPLPGNVRIRCWRNLIHNPSTSVTRMHNVCVIDVDILVDHTGAQKMSIPLIGGDLCSGANEDSKDINIGIFHFSPSRSFTTKWLAYGNDRTSNKYGVIEEFLPHDDTLRLSLQTPFTDGRGGNYYYGVGSALTYHEGGGENLLDNVGTGDGPLMITARLSYGQGAGLGNLVSIKHVVNRLKEKTVTMDDINMIRLTMTLADD